MILCVLSYVRTSLEMTKKLKIPTVYQNRNNAGKIAYPSLLRDENTVQYELI